MAWAPLMRLALGALYMRPEDFWAMTYAEYACALQGWKKYGPPAWLGGSDAPEKATSSGDVAATLRFVDEMQARHPDGRELDPRVKALLRERRGRS